MYADSGICCLCDDWAVRTRAFVSAARERDFVFHQASARWRASAFSAGDKETERIVSPDGPRRLR